MGLMTNDKEYIVAIDGPAGAGKSSVSRVLAQKIGFVYIDTGAMYRAMTYKVMKCKIDIEDEKTVAELCVNTSIFFKTIDGQNRIFIDNEELSDEIRTPEVTNNVHYLARMQSVREHMVCLQRLIGRESKKAVMEGRDIGSVVFPDAFQKIYLDASAQERAKRRTNELAEKDIIVDYEQVLSEIKERDQKDFSRTIGALKIVDDADYVDTTNLDFDSVINKLEQIIRKKL